MTVPGLATLHPRSRAPLALYMLQPPTTGMLRARCTSLRGSHSRGWASLARVVSSLIIPIWIPSHLGLPPLSYSSTLLTTAECLLHPNRNPGLSQAEIEARLMAFLGVTRVIWLPRGLVADTDTNGHVDNIACFARPGVVVLAWSDDAEDPQYERSREALAVLEAAVDARGRRLEVVKLPQGPAMHYREEETASIEVWTVPGGLQGYCQSCDARGAGGCGVGGEARTLHPDASPQSLVAAGGGVSPFEPGRASPLMLIPLQCSESGGGGDGSSGGHSAGRGLHQLLHLQRRRGHAGVGHPRRRRKVSCFLGSWRSLEGGGAVFLECMGCEEEHCRWDGKGGGTATPACGTPSQTNHRCRAKVVLQEVFPDREVVQVYTREILLGGGNVHCITQQQPLGKPAAMGGLAISAL